jgi:hypothetical protein
MINKKLISLLLTGFFVPSISNAEDTISSQATEPAPASSETTSTPPPAPAPVQQPRLVGPTGATGVIRRSDRRQDRRLEEDLEDLGDAIDRQPRNRR